MSDVKLLKLAVSVLMLSAFAIPTAVAPVQASEETTTGQGELTGLKHRVERLEELVTQFNPTQPINIIVDCYAGESVQAAIDRYEDARNELNIMVRGMCTEEVDIDRDHIEIYGEHEGDGLSAPSTSVFATLDIKRGASDVRLRQLTIIGGNIGLHASGNATLSARELHVVGANAGIVVNSGASADIEDSLIEHCVHGVGVSWDGKVALNSTEINNIQWFGLSAANNGSISTNDGTTVQNVSFIAAYADAGGSITLTDTTIENNATGVMARGGGIVTIHDGSLVQTSESIGVVANTGGVIQLERDARIVNNGGDGVLGWVGGTIGGGNAVVIENNGGTGVNLMGGSNAGLEGVTISRNGGDGVRLHDTSVAIIGVNVQIIDNGGTAIACDGSPAVAQITGTPDTISGNGSDMIDCPVN